LTQKYFQKLAKARQNGEEGEITMEGRGGVASVTSASSMIMMPKRRKQVTGTKRKAIQSVVASAQRQGKKLAAAQAASGVPNPMAPFPAVAPTLAHFMLPPNTEETDELTGQAPISGLEDSMYVFSLSFCAASGFIDLKLCFLRSTLSKSIPFTFIRTASGF
jgi:hypothetical protein